MVSRWWPGDKKNEKPTDVYVEFIPDPPVGRWQDDESGIACDMKVYQIRRLPGEGIIRVTGVALDKKKNIVGEASFSNWSLVHPPQTIFEYFADKSKVALMGREMKHALIRHLTSYRGQQLAHKAADKVSHEPKNKRGGGGGKGGHFR